MIQAQESDLPEVKDVEITGDINEEKTGVDVFSDIDISLTVDNMSEDNFLTDEGLHWSEDTYVEAIQGEITGSMSDPIFWSHTQPSSNISSFSINNGDSGRIVNVGKTKSGKVLDLIYTVKGTNSKEWEEYSKYKDRQTPRGIGFVGEQYLQNTTGNSIVSLISGTSYIEMEYKIVEHNTYNENPVVLSFITTDIDGGQGVQTDLSNLATIIPENADLSIDEYGIIYDNALPKGNKLNGSKDLPKGGYLGVGFLSHFNYTFYAPSPKRIEDRDSYPFCARYDLFGSSLQAHVSIQNMEHLQFNYLNTKNEKIQESKTINGIHVQDKIPETPSINGYEFSHVSFDYQTNHTTVLNYIYKQYYRINVNYIDENGNKLKDSNTTLFIKLFQKKNQK